MPAMYVRLGLVMALCLSVSACGSCNAPSTMPFYKDATPDQDMSTTQDMSMDMPTVKPSFATSTRRALVWKRRDALVLDLSRALGLPKDGLCNELDSVPCADVYQVQLGSNEPFVLGMYAPVGSPLATTPAVVDRMVLASCASAVKAVKAGEVVVFESLDWAESTAPDTAEAQDAHTQELYRRFLSRDPNAAELEAARALAKDASGQLLTVEEYAKVSCYAVGTLTEFVMY